MCATVPRNLHIVTPTPQQPLIQAIAAALEQPTAAALVGLPRLTSVVQSDPFLSEQLTTLHQIYELHPTAARGLLDRVRTRLAWWLMGSELQQANATHAALVRITDSLLVHLDHERTSRRRLETHLAALHQQLAASTPQNNQPSDQPEPSTQTALHLVWHSSFAHYGGYSNSARAFVLGLDRRQVAVRPLFLYGSDHDEQVMMEQLNPRLRTLQATPLRLDVPQVVYAAGDRFSKNSGSYRIGFTMLEVDRLPATWVEQANQMDEVWTPSAWGASVFRDSGVTRPIHVIPLGVDTTTFQPGPARAYLQDRTIFVSVFEWSPRKGGELLLQAYRKAFRATDRVLLVLKIDAREPATNPIQELASLLPPDAPPVCVLYNERCPAERLAELYQAADCFVLPTRGEGWGMPVLEAMACGIPAIVTYWSGITTFLTEENGYPLPLYGLVPTNQSAPHYQQARWAEPDVGALIELLRRVHTEPHERRRKGQQAAIDAQQLTWERAVDSAYRRLVTIA